MIAKITIGSGGIEVETSGQVVSLSIHEIKRIGGKETSFRMTFRDEGITTDSEGRSPFQMQTITVCQEMKIS